jgi:hypothetical protein
MPNISGTFSSSPINQQAWCHHRIELTFQPEKNKKFLLYDVGTGFLSHLIEYGLRTRFSRIPSSLLSNFSFSLAISGVSPLPWSSVWAEKKDTRSSSRIYFTDKTETFMNL